MFAMRALTVLLHASVSSSLVYSADTLSQSSRCVSDAFSKPQVGRGITILSIHAQPQHNFTSIPGGPLRPSLSGLEFCQVQIYLTHQTQHDSDLGIKGTYDKVLVEVWLPLTSEYWNGRFQATGGAGFATGMFGAELGAAVMNGWAAASTDGGHDADLAKLADASWALADIDANTDGHSMYRRRRINWNLLQNFASRSSVDQILIGKAVTEQYYQMKPHHSYWNGCSTGGRQGYAIAQKYPELLDGILANAPAISFVSLLMGELWPQVVMNKHKTYLSNCELESFRVHAIEGCQVLADVKNGILEDPSDCTWVPEESLGSVFQCDGQEVVITKPMLAVIRDIWDGPGGSAASNKFPGFAWGVPMTRVANITVGADGTLAQFPFPIAASWLRHIVMQGSELAIGVLDTEDLDALWVSAQYEFGGLLNTDDPDLARLRDSGTKLLTWHGMSDQLIPYQNTINYRQKVEAVMGEVDEYYRLFLAPGVGHCGGGSGPVPKDPLAALVHWVEDDEPPETLDAAVTDHEWDLVTKELCLWPARSDYMGIGDPKRASTWTCKGGTERAAQSRNENEPWIPIDYQGTQQPQRGYKKQGQDSGGSSRASQVLGGLKDRIEGLGLGLRIG
ncbi:tannase-domain-containing protein [Ophiobolus disseminans]|uniref:Carboxylic ester hydrolase n=1 Tax=Ophiobolus disseminans TaxID=1469910 RepID=A0A6A6ZVT0_9PLEO|nr:tannase-domain-containing protein [Ophiobolus disseminans]